MKPSRHLALRRETLTELTTDELAQAAAGSPGVPTLEAGCDTNDVNDYLRDLALRLTIHQHCSWSCI